MPNDDLGQFPTPVVPSTDTTAPNTTTTPNETSILEDINAPIPDKISDEPIVSTPNDTLSNPEPIKQAPSFEETPDEIPSMISATPAIESIPDPMTEPTPTSAAEAAPDYSSSAFTSSNTPAPDTYDAPTPVSQPVYQAPAIPPAPIEVPATIVPKGGSSFGSLITIVLLLIAGISIAGVVFLLSQSSQLKQQLGEITQTLNSQNTTVTPTPTSSVIEFTTPTPSMEATESATPSATPTPNIFLTPTPSIATLSATSTIMPLADASRALKVAINHLPNAQLILVKTENASNPILASTKYFFRQDLTTKKYFYVLIAGGKEPEVIDKAIYVTPDNNIPSLNDMVVGSTLGMDLDEAFKIANPLCTSGLCSTATVKAQYIKSGLNSIWQLAYDPAGDTKDVLIIQMNATTKEVLYKSPGF